VIRTTLAISFTLYAVLVGTLLKECAFLSPLRKLIWETYQGPIVWFSALLLLNLSATIYLLLRKVALKDTGDKLAHLEKQLRGQATISRELTERILDPR
jgi:low affinity Fe/Cu permease